MKVGAGILMRARDTGRVLLLKRGDKGDEPGSWCLPGGHADADETALQTAVRETVEEAGPNTPVVPEDCILWTRRQAKQDFTTFLQYIDHEFEPQISDEHIGAGWFALDDLPEPIHPGLRIAVDKFHLDELGIAKAIIAKELVSPQKYENVWLFDLRITGTGGAYREQFDEHVWRPPEDYLTEEFLERCQGLPVIWVHPKSAILNSEEYGKRVIGAIMIPHIEGDEVWGIAKIHDEPAAEEMRTRQLSTSPGVKGVGNNTAKLEDGSNVLIEKKPRLLDHLAVVPEGVWDKGDKPSGVASVTTNGDFNMSEAEAKTAEGEKDAKRADAAAGGEVPDKLLSRLDAASEGLSKVSERLDAYEKERAEKDARKKAKKDAKQARKDATTRMDELKARCDSGSASEEEKAEFKKLEEAHADARAKKDAAKKDSDTEAAKAAHEAEGAAHKAEGEAMKDDEQARADAQVRNDARFNELAELVKSQAKTIAELTNRTAPIPDEMIDKMGDIQARCDSVAQMHGTSAPRPMPGETPLAYRKRLVKPFIQHSPTWKDAGVETIAMLPEKAFEPVEAQIYADAAQAARDPAAVPAGTLRPMTVQRGGHTIITYHGSPSAWMNPLSGPTRQRVTGSFKHGSN